jgi:hypothetical protein
MKKTELLRALQTEIRRHSFDTFVDQPPSIAQGGSGVGYTRMSEMPEAIVHDGELHGSLGRGCIAKPHGEAVHRQVSLTHFNSIESDGLSEK